MNKHNHSMINGIWELHCEHCGKVSDVPPEDVIKDDNGFLVWLCPHCNQFVDM